MPLLEEIIRIMWCAYNVLVAIQTELYYVLFNKDNLRQNRVSYHGTKFYMNHMYYGFLNNNGQHCYCYCQRIRIEKRWRGKYMNDLLMLSNVYQNILAIQMGIYYVSSNDNDQWIRRISNVFVPSNLHLYHQCQILSAIQMQLYYKFSIKNNLKNHHYLVLLLSAYTIIKYRNHHHRHQ